MVKQEFIFRIRLEKQIMSKHLPQFRLYRSGADRCFIGTQTTTVNNRKYKLRLNIPTHYPDQKPLLYVISPVTLYQYKNLNTVNSVGLSHSFHTLSNGPNGCVQICHSNNSSWNASKTCVGVFMKGILWLEAYETHLTTGESIANIFDNWQRRM